MKDPTSRLLAAGLLALCATSMAGCTATPPLDSGHAKVEERIEKLRAKTGELDRRSAVRLNAPAVNGGKDL